MIFGEEGGDEEDNWRGVEAVGVLKGTGSVEIIGNVDVAMDIISSWIDCNRGNNSANEGLSWGVAFQHWSTMILL